MNKRVNRKSVFAVFTALICVCLIFAVSVLQCRAVVITYLNGDVDGDNNISILDATKVQRLLADLCDDPDGLIAIRADVNKDGVDITDATYIQRHIVQYEVPFQIGVEMKWISQGENELPEIEA